KFGFLAIGTGGKTKLALAAPAKRPTVEIVTGEPDDEIETETQGQSREIGDAERGDSGADCDQAHNGRDEYLPHALDEQPQEREEKTPPAETFLDKAHTIGVGPDHLGAFRSRMDGIAWHQPVNDPLVEGMRPFWRGSISTAWRRARARPL